MEHYSVFDRYKYFLYQKSDFQRPGYIIDKTNIHSFYLIAKSNSNGMEVLDRSKNEVIAKTLFSHKIETMCGPVIMSISKGFYDYFTAYSYVFPDSKIARYWDIYESTLDDYLRDDMYYEISLPRTYTKTTFQDFTRLIENLERQQCKRVATPYTI